MTLHFYVTFEQNQFKNSSNHISPTITVINVTYGLSLKKSAVSDKAVLYQAKLKSSLNSKFCRYLNFSHLFEKQSSHQPLEVKSNFSNILVNFLNPEIHNTLQVIFINSHYLELFMINCYTDSKASKVGHKLGSLNTQTNVFQSIR